MRRLAALSAHLSPAPRREQQHPRALPTAAADALDIPRLRVEVGADGSGRVLAEDMAALRAREQQAVAAGDYLAADKLQKLANVVGPRERPLTIDDCAPESLEDQIEVFLVHGLCVIRNVLSGDSLERARAAWLLRETAARRRFDEEHALAPPLPGSERLRLEGEKAYLFDAEGEPLRRRDGGHINHCAYRTFFDPDELCTASDEFVELLDCPKARAPPRL